MANSEVRGLIKEMGLNWKNAAEEAKAEGAGVPDAKYIGRVIGAEMKPSSNGVRANFHLEILEGDAKGAKVTKSDPVTPDSAKWFFKNLARFGYDPTKVTETNVEKIMAEIGKAGHVVEFATRQNGDFVNVSLYRTVPGYEGAGGGGAGDDEDEDEGGTAAVGMKVAKGDEWTGEIVELVDEATVRVKRDDTGKIVKIKLELLEEIGDDEDEEEDEEEDEDEEEEDDAPLTPAVGMKVSFQWKNKPETGVISEVIDAEFCKVKKDSDGKTAKVKSESLTLENADETDDEEEEEEEDEEEEEEETPPPPKRRGRPAGSTNKKK